MLLDKLIGEVAGACGINMGEEQGTQKAGAAKGGGFQQIGDSFKNGDVMGGIGQILGMCTGMSGMGGMGGGGMNVTEMMNPSMFMDPLTKMLFEQISGQGYSKKGQDSERMELEAQCLAHAAKAQALSHAENYARAVNVLKDNFDLLDTASGVGGKDGLIGRCDLEAAAKNPALPAEVRSACQYLLNNPAAFKQLDVGAGIGKCDGLIGKCDVDAALKALPKKAEPAKTSGETKTEGSGGSSKTSGETKTEGSSGSSKTGEAKAGGTYQEKWSEAVNQLKDNFDLLDTASGIGGKDGLIGRCDLEAAAKNPDLPAELRAACQFLLNNPAAFNQLDVGAGIGKCDGLIGKCDVDAVLKTLPKKADPAKTEETKKTSTPDQAKADGKGGTSKTGSKDDAKADESEKADKSGSSSEANGSKEISNPYENLELEDLLWQVMKDINGELNDVANKLKTTAKDSEDYSKLQLELEKLMQRRKEMYTLISNMNAAEHAMSMTAINNIR